MRSVAIVGGGPAGLAAAYSLHRVGVDFRLFDEGAPLASRRHDCADHLGSGIGGAGLFSDGKFSYYPSGTHLYTLAEPARLRRAYESIGTLLADAGIEAPPFPDRGDATSPTTGLRLKTYESHYGTLAQRIRLTAAMTRGYEARIRCHAQVERVSRGDGDYRILTRDLRTGATNVQTFTDILLASGRFGGRRLAEAFDGDLPFEAQRVELGIRIEHPNEIGFMRGCKTPDVKFIMEAGSVEIRTFCTCRRGEVWQIPYDGVSALSGRSDGPPTGFSNFGLLPRFAGGMIEAGNRILDHFEQAGADKELAMWQPLPDFLGRTDGAEPQTLSQRPWHPRENFRRGDIAGALHPELTAILRGAIEALVARHPDILSAETICLFPAIEGVGSYPATDLDLKVPGETIWCCGDVVGRFRGLIPALVSGEYAARAAAAFAADHATDGLEAIVAAAPAWAAEAPAAP